LAIALHVRRGRDRWDADRVLAAVEASTKAALARGEAPPALLRGHLLALARAERQDPASASLRLARGSQHLLLRQPEAAVRAYSEALRLEARPEIRLNLGRAQLMLGEREEAERNFALAVMLEPDLGREVPTPAAEPEPGAPPS
jgi:tetratricopeptide (TPR) repeat protein